jgi:hypothetical protein
MPRLLVLAASALGVVLALSGCAPSSTHPPAAAAEPILRGEWELRAGTDSTGTMDLSNTFIALTIGDAAHTLATSPCSTEPVSVRGSVGAIWVTAPRTANPGCADTRQRQLDSRFLRALNRTRVATVVNGSLVLASSTARLEFQLARPSPLDAALNRDWSLVSVYSALGSEQRAVSFEGYADLRVTSRQSLTIDTLCSHTFETFRPVNGLLEVRGADGVGQSCPGAAQKLEDILTRVLYTDRFVITADAGHMVIANSSHSLILNFTRTT